MNRQQYLLAQIGKKSQKQLSMSMLLDPNELPGGEWSLKGERSWRIGKVGQRDAASLRAKSSGAFTAIRSMEQPSTSKWVIVKVSPMVSPEDALLVPPDSDITLFTAPKSSAIMAGERYVDIPIDLGLSNAKAFELTASESNRVATYRIVTGTVDRVIASICCSGWGDGWTWQEIRAITAAQDQKIRKIESK